MLTTLGGFLVAGAVVRSCVALDGRTGGVRGLRSRSAVDSSCLPAGADLVLLAALVAYSGAGGVANLVLSNWARDKGYGMGSASGYIPAAVGGEKVSLAHIPASRSADDAESMERWRGWWRIVRVDQWGVFFARRDARHAAAGAAVRDVPAAGSDIQGLGISAALASSRRRAGGALARRRDRDPRRVDPVQDTARQLRRHGARDHRHPVDRQQPRPRAGAAATCASVYYSVLAVLVVWGIVALRLAQPIVLLKIGANIAGAVFVIASLHLLYINTRLLPPHVRPPAWRRAALVFMALFYGTFVMLSALSVWSA